MIMSDQTSDSPRSDIHVAGNQQKKWDLIMQGNKLCGVISNSTLIFFCAVRSDTKLTEGGSNKLMNCSASHMFVSRGLHVPIAPVLETLCYNYA